VLYLLALASQKGQGSYDELKPPPAAAGVDVEVVDWPGAVVVVLLLPGATVVVVEPAATVIVVEPAVDVVVEPELAAAEVVVLDEGEPTAAPPEVRDVAEVVVEDGAAGPCVVVVDDDAAGPCVVVLLLWTGFAVVCAAVVEELEGCCWLADVVVVEIPASVVDEDDGGGGGGEVGFEEVVVVEPVVIVLDTGSGTIWRSKSAGQEEALTPPMIRGEHPSW
jgi:hypothetical protein